MSKNKSVTLTVIAYIIVAVIIVCGVVTVSQKTFNRDKHVKYYNPQASTKVLPKKMLRTPKYNHHRNFQKTVFPPGLRGVYVASEPVKNKKLKKYYRVTSLIRITQNNIYQQFSLTSRRLPMKKISATKPAGSHGAKLERKRIKRLIRQNIPKRARTIVNHNHLRNLIGNYNIDMTPGNPNQNDNDYSYTLKQATMLSGYSKKKLAKVIGYKKLIIIPPEEYGKIKIHSSKNNELTFNNKATFKKISSVEAKRLLRQDEIATFFLGY